MSRDQSAEIRSIDDCELKAKFFDMGLYPGKRVKLLFRAPLGDPIAIDIEGYTLSLRCSEAKRIRVRIENKDNPHQGQALKLKYAYGN